MAGLQLRNGSYRLLFQYLGQQKTLTIGRVAPSEAKKWQGKVEHLLMRLEQNMLEVPRGVSIADFLLHDGKPPVDPAVSFLSYTLNLPTHRSARTTIRFPVQLPV